MVRFEQYDCRIQSKVLFLKVLLYQKIRKFEFRPKDIEIAEIRGYFTTGNTVEFFLQDERSEHMKQFYHSMETFFLIGAKATMCDLYIIAYKYDSAHAHNRMRSLGANMTLLMHSFDLL